MPRKSPASPQLRARAKRHGVRLTQGSPRTLKSVQQLQQQISRKQQTKQQTGKRPECAGHTRTGARCRRRVAHEGDFCASHRHQAHQQFHQFPHQAHQQFHQFPQHTPQVRQEFDKMEQFHQFPHQAHQQFHQFPQQTPQVRQEFDKMERSISGLEGGPAKRDPESMRHAKALIRALTVDQLRRLGTELGKARRLYERRGDIGALVYALLRGAVSILWGSTTQTARIIRAVIAHPKLGTLTTIATAVAFLYSQYMRGLVLEAAGDTVAAGASTALVVYGEYVSVHDTYVRRGILENAGLAVLLAGLGRASTVLPVTNAMYTMSAALVSQNYGMIAQLGEIGLIGRLATRVGGVVTATVRKVSDALMPRGEIAPPGEGYMALPWNPQAHG
jgi:hypothetical protein